MRLLALLLFVSIKGLAQSTDTTARIDKLFSAWNNSTPGVSVLVARGEQILYQKAFGLADLERTVPITTNSIFEAGSVSKQFTAMSILLLESEGKLKLTDDVRKYIPELPVYEAPITIQQLLNHTSGLKDWGSVGSLTGFPRGQRNYTLALGLHIICQQKTTNYKPGTEYNYSNSNYTLQVVIIERVSNQKFEDFTREKLFKPLGMTSTRWRSNFHEVVPGRALAYGPWDNGKYELDMVVENIHGHGGLLTTTGDLLKWNRILETHQVGGDAVYKKRIERGKLANGEVLHYAAGLGYGDVNGVVEIGHTGSTAGYRAWLGYYPSKKITVALLSNDATFASYDFAQAIGEIYFGKKEESAHVEMPEPPAIDKPADQYNYDYTGKFYSEDAECSFTIVKKNDKLVATNDAQEEITLVPDDHHVYDLNGRQLEFKVNKKKIVTGFNVSMGNAKNIPFKKVSK
jgi:CubicO group peptidase (beta-lactamase class C family)